MPERSCADPSAPLAAVVDLGTNAARLALATLDDAGRLESRGRWRELIRLGEGVREIGLLSESAMERGLACLARFAQIIQEHRVHLVDAVATSALREARNADVFIERALQLGIAMRVIPAEEEARLALAGVFAGGAGRPGRALVFDVGGGSLEIILSGSGEVREMASLPAGVVYLTERYLKTMPTPDEQVQACSEAVDAMLMKVDFADVELAEISFIGCGGVVALAWFLTEGAPQGGRVDGLSVPGSFFDEWVDRFAGLTYEQRRELPGFEAGREDVALAGLIVVRALLRWGGKKDLGVSTGGVREGRLLELLRPGA
ncbi:MAG: hypothetical protein F4X91_06635 [Nitrospinae bacterium]|nr:hypothetical protein [Nitrospinota bacterium]